MADGAQVVRNVSWIVTGAVCAVALANWTTKWVMLLIPLTLISAARFWLRTPGREFWGVLIGLALCPVLLSLADEACASSPEFLRRPAARSLALRCRRSRTVRPRSLAQSPA